MKKILLGIGLLFTSIVYADFKDVPKDHPNYEAIKWVEDQGIIKGYEDGTFKPDATINRAEFVKIIVETLHVTSLPEGNCFPDVKTEWYAPYVCYAKEKGIISGYSDGTFKPEKTITFVEAAKITLKVLKPEIQEDPKNWYKNYVDFLTQHQFIPNTVRQYGHEMTRGEIAEMVYRIKENITTKKSIEILPSEYAKDEVSGYYEGNELWPSKGKNFQYLGDRYAVDDEKVYFAGNALWNADRESFSIKKENPDCAYDKNHIYRKGLTLEKNYEYFCDSKDNVIMVPSLNGLFVKKENGVYFEQCYGSYGARGIVCTSNILENSDPETFQMLSADEIFSAKDENNYYRLCYKQDREGEFIAVFKNSVDIETLKPVGEKENSLYFKDKNRVYKRCGETLENSDPDSFEIINESYAKDKNNVYSEGKILEGAKPQKFVILKNGYSKDINNVFLDSGSIEGADPNTFEIIDINYNYAKDKNYAYINWRKIQGSDGKTFEIINHNYQKDKNQVYFEGKVLENFTPTSFQILKNDYIKDSDTVAYNYYRDVKLIKDVDAGTFETIECCGYAKDKNYVYLKGEIIKNADPKTFKRLFGGYFGDKNFVFKNNEILGGKDPNTLVDLNWGYTKDKNNAYHDDKIIPNADPNSFELVRDYLAKDKKAVYFQGNEIKDIDVNSFRNLNFDYIKDQNNVFLCELSKGCSIFKGTDSNTFEVIDYTYAKDKNHVYKYSKILDDVDPTIFDPATYKP